MTKWLVALLLTFSANAFAAIAHTGSATPCSDATVGGTADCTVTMPSASGSDIFVVTVSGASTADGAPVIVEPACMTAGKVDEAEYFAAGSIDLVLGVYVVAYSDCTAASYNFQVTRSAGNGRVTVAVDAFSGASSTLDVTYVQGTHRVTASNTINVDPASITTATNNAVVHYAYAATHDEITAFGAPTGTTLRSSAGVGDSDRKVATATIARPTAGAYDASAWTHTGTATNTESQTVVISLAEASGTCPAACAGGRTPVCITNTASSTYADNILNDQSPAVAANQDTVCHDPTSDILSDTVTVSASGWPAFQSGSDMRTDDFDYCIMDNGAACGTDGTYQVTQTPTLSDTSGTVSTGTTTATLSVVVAQVEGTCYAYVSTSSTPPSVANHKSGGGSPAYHNADASCSAAQTWSATGLTQGTTYYAHFLQTNAATAPIDSAQLTSDAFFTVAAGDTTPTAFSFTDALSAIAGNGDIESDAITVAGTTAATNVNTTVSGCDWSKDSGGGYGAWTSAAGQVQLGYTVKLRATVSSEQTDIVACTLTIGGVSDIWYVGTLEQGRAAGLPSAIENALKNDATRYLNIP